MDIVFHRHPCNRSDYQNVVTPGSTVSQEYARSFHTYDKTLIVVNNVSPCGRLNTVDAKVGVSLNSRVFSLAAFSRGRTFYSGLLP